jgi:hypothetical protein
MTKTFLLSLAFGLLTACSGSADTGEGGPQVAELAVRPGPEPKVVCLHATESSCMAETGCAWDACAQECIYVGEVTVHDPVPAACAGGTESACIAETGCGWDGSAQKCIYLGQVVPQ